MNAWKILTAVWILAGATMVVGLGIMLPFLPFEDGLVRSSSWHEER